MLSFLLNPIKFLFYSNKDIDITEKCNRDISDIEKEYVIHPYLLDNLDMEHIHKFIENKKDTENDLSELPKIQIDTKQHELPKIKSDIELPKTEDGINLPKIKTEMETETLTEQLNHNINEEDILIGHKNKSNITKKTKSGNKRKQKKNKKIKSKQNKKKHRREKILRKKQEHKKKRLEKQKQKYNLRKRT